MSLALQTIDPVRRRATIAKRHLQVLRRVRLDYWRPSVRGDCCNIPRPCPFVSCRFNLYLDVKDNGNIRLNFPDIDPHQMGASCALDVADEGGATLERVGQAVGVTREMIRQYEERMLEELQSRRTEHGEIDAPRLPDDDELGRPNLPKAWR
jgi:hypothetical protein